MLTLYLAQILNSGLALGAVYGLMALGFSLIYNSSRLINFAQGELLLVGGLGLYSVSLAMDVPPFVAVAIACGWGFSLGYVLYHTTLGVALRGHPLQQLMITVAASITWQGAVILVWGKEPLMLPQLVPLDSLRLGPLFFTGNTLTALALAVGSGVSLALFLARTRAGRAIRAVSMNALAARLMGINPAGSQALAFGLSGILAALAGMSVGPQTMLQYDMGFGIGLKGFVAATLGGYGSLGKVFAGGIFLGLLEAALVLFMGAQLKEAVSYTLLIILLVLLPHKEKAHAHGG